MFYCVNCGNKLNNNDNYCTKCGNLINKNYNVDNRDNVNERGKTISLVLGVVSLVGSFTLFFAPLCLILAIIGLIISINVNKKIDNTISIVFNSVGILISLIITFILGIIFFIFVNRVNYGEYEHYIDDMFDDFEYKYDF